MANNSCCSYWFAIYFAISVTLGIIAISSVVHSSSKNSVQQVSPPSITHDISVNASNALRKAGFTFMAQLLHSSPQSPPFFLPPQNSTLFAIKDSSIKNTTLPLYLLKNLLQYHTSTSRFSMQDLLSMSRLTCIPTLFRGKNVAITKVDLDPKKRSIEINNVLISNPDIFLDDQVVIHGVLAPFSSLHPQGVLDFIHSSSCHRFNNNNNNNSSVTILEEVVKMLSSKGYTSFSIALHYVLDSIKEDWVSLNSATIFAPPDFDLMSYPSTLLDKTVRIHILPQRFSYKELISLPVRTLLKTLMPDNNLEIDGVLDFMSGIVISGVEIVVPDMFTSEKFVVHGISRVFKMAELATS
ncbi:hypothetical protein TanjilG_11363 [Lupinus angustifolius]|uniref:FAS1 domain-containing protein n=1 Tax=Lupinus angustifolius TaxID=3871 RepID=A0A1J7I382_LUPAN|nr:PREDICTED: fasciclin-like arabinogalactan protein 21 [Lupinus angustifolius]OIW09225.1 hypothetical protein TanjilG_11363 [Lupinus angustifolius]